MEHQENITRRDALKRMAKTAMVVTIASVFPKENVLADSTNLSYYNVGYANTKDYVDKCYGDYSNYRNYSNYNDYYNYSNYRDYNNYNDYSNYNDYKNSCN